jgi:hypothetical protein
MMVRQRVSELRLPAPERAAARAERRVEAAIRRERDNYHTPERRAAALQAELRRFPGSEWTDW